MQYTANCRARIITEVSAYLGKMLNSSNVHEIREAEYSLADSFWFKQLCNAVSLQDFEEVIKSIEDQRFYYIKEAQDKRYTKDSINKFERSAHILFVIEAIINEKTGRKK